MDPQLKKMIQAIASDPGISPALRKVLPAISVLDPKFRYVASIDTNLHKTFARIRREQAAKPANVSPLVKRKEAK